MDFDQALDAILALESLWAERGGRVRLADLGVAAHRLVVSRGQFALPPERWRGYPGAFSRRNDRVRDR
jgi:hypothetical protein